MVDLIETNSRPALKTFVLKHDILIKENDEPAALRLEPEENPSKLFEEFIKMIKSSSNYLSIYLKRNGMPMPLQSSKKRNIVSFQ